VIGPKFVISVGDDEEDREVANPPTEESEQFERGAICPMGIFGDDNGRPSSSGEGREHRPEELVTRVTVEGMLSDLEAEGGRQVAHRTEGPRRRQRITASAQYCHQVGHPLAERVNQGRLADTGLAADEHDPTVSGGGLTQVLRQLIEVRFALEQLHCGDLLGVESMIRRSAEGSTVVPRTSERRGQ
jgi:hypothetical protein